MNKKIASCLLALASILAFAFCASADLIPPRDGFDFAETENAVSQSYEGEIERIDISDEFASIVAEANIAPETEDAADTAEDETVILYGSAEVPEDHTLPDVEIEQTQGSIVKPIVICVVIGLVIALIVVLTVKSGYKPVHRKRDAAEYLVDGSLNVTASDEKFIRSERRERKIEKQDTSGSK